MFTSSILAYYCKLSESSLTDPILNNMPAKFEAYGNSKVLNIIAAKILAKKLKDFGIAVYSVNPGYTTTPMLQHTYNSSFFYIPKHIYTYAMVYWSQVNVDFNEILFDYIVFFRRCMKVFKQRYIWLYPNTSRNIRESFSVIAE